MDNKNKVFFIRLEKNFLKSEPDELEPGFDFAPG